MSDSGNRSCLCGAVYLRTESMAKSREIASFECGLCGSTLESWNTAWVPSYQLVVAPVQKPGQSPES